MSLFVKDELINAIFRFFNIMSCYLDWYLLLPYMLSLTSTSDFCHVTCIFYCRILILERMIWMISLVDLLSLLGLAWEIYMGGFAWYLLFVQWCFLSKYLNCGRGWCWVNNPVLHFKHLCQSFGYHPLESCLWEIN